MDESDDRMVITPDLQASLLCDDVRQERNGKFILIGIFEGMMISSRPATLGRLCLVNRWCSGDGEFQQQTRIMASDGRTPVVEGRVVPIKLANVNHVATSVEIFVNLKIPDAGVYWVEVSLDQQLKLRYPLHIRMKDE